MRFKGSVGSQRLRRRAGMLTTIGVSALITGSIAFAAVSEPERVVLGETDRVAGVEDRTLGLSRVVIPPGTRLPLHRHGGTQIGRVVRGILTYTVRSGTAYLHRGQPGSGSTLLRRITAGQSVRIRRGQWLVEPPTDIHRAANLGREPVVVLLSTLFRDGAPPAIPVDPDSLADRRVSTSASEREAGDSNVATGKRLTTRFFRLLVRKDRPGLRKLLVKSWQIERADGTGVTGRKKYLEDLGEIDVKRFRLTRFRATRIDNVLIVRYRSQVTESIDDSPLTQSKAPRLSTFARINGQWRMTSHANFAPLPR